MRRFATICLPIACAGLLSGCTGTGLFFDHTTQMFSRNPNMPAGSSETFLRVRGEPVDIPPLTPEQGNVWPTDTGPDISMQDLQKRQDEEIRRGNSNLPQSSSSPPPGPNPQVNRANGADRGLPPPIVPPAPAIRRSPTVQTPNGPSVDVTGQGTGRGYRQLESPTPGGSGILVPNGNGTSTLIGPDGSVQTVPTRR
jgi:hypothetical protein